MAEREILVGSSSADAGIICVWDISTGSELTHFHGCPSPRNALTSIGRSSFAASQIHKPSPYSASSAGPICLWRLGDPPIQSPIFPCEQIGPLSCTNDGAYLMGGGASGQIYVWELATRQLVRSWHAQKKTVSCLILSDDESLLISGGDDGFVNVWPLIRILDIAEGLTRETQVLSLYSWAAHALSVTGLASGIGGCNAILVSCSLDCTVKMWSLGLGTHLRTLNMPTAINSVVVDPSEHALYAGGTDGRIYIAVLKLYSRRSNGIVNVDGIVGSLFDHSGPITALSFSGDGFSLISASEDCTIRLWDIRNSCLLRIFEHKRGPVSSILVFPFLEQQLCSSNDGLKCKQLLIPKIGKTAISVDSICCSMGIIGRRIKEMEVMKGNLVVVNEDRRRALDMLDKMIHVYRKLLELCMSEAITESEKNKKEERQGKGDKMVSADKSIEEGQPMVQ